jgi:predicted nucleic acid-binding Zn ribbon protein
MVGYPYTEEEMNEKKALIAKQKIKEIEKAEIAKQKIKEIEKEHIIPVPSLSCENYGCEKPIVSTRKKYCSDKCRLQKSRADYETRNPKRRRKTETPTPQTLPAPPVPPEPSELCSSIVCNNKVMGGRRSCSDKCRKRAYRQRKKGLLRQT